MPLDNLRPLYPQVILDIIRSRVIEAGPALLMGPTVATIRPVESIDATKGEAFISNEDMD